MTQNKVPISKCEDQSSYPRTQCAWFDSCMELHSLKVEIMDPQSELVTLVFLLKLFFYYYVYV